MASSARRSGLAQTRCSARINSGRTAGPIPKRKTAMHDAVAPKIDLKQNDYTSHADVYEHNRFSGRQNQYLEMLRRRAVLRGFETCTERDALLDVGCGTGRGLSYHESLGWRQLCGLDFTRAMLDIATRNLQNGRHPSQLTLVQGDAFELPFPDNSFSAVMSLNFLHMFRFGSQKELVKEMVRVCRNGGVVTVELESIHKGLFFSRYLEQRRVVDRTKFNSVWEVADIFPKNVVTGVKVYGTALPAAYRILSYVPRAGSVIERVAHKEPFKWLCERVVVSAVIDKAD